MSAERTEPDLQAVYDRLTRLEARGEARDDRMARLETAIEHMTQQLDTMAGDLRDAKTGLRIGLWVSGTLVPAASGLMGWFAAHHLWPK